VALVGEKRYKVFIEISEGKRSLGISVHRWKDNIEIGIKEIGWKGEDRFIQPRIVTNGSPLLMW
jgi:hypothetical protein